MRRPSALSAPYRAPTPRPSIRSSRRQVAARLAAKSGLHPAVVEYVRWAGNGLLHCGKTATSYPGDGRWRDGSSLGVLVVDYNRSDTTGAIVLNWFLKPKEALVLQTVSPLILKLSLFLVTAAATHLVMSFGQTLIHYKVAHHPMGGKIFRNHINFHHTHYSDAHLVSRTYLGDEGNTTPYFLIPVFLVGGCAYFLLPLSLFVVMVIASAASFYAHVFFDKEYHVEGSRLQRFAWFRRKQELHFVHHRHADSNFAVIHFFWDKILGTYRRPDAGAYPSW